MEINKMNITEAKAFAYDCLSVLESTKQKLDLINPILVKLDKEKKEAEKQTMIDEIKQSLAETKEEPKEIKEIIENDEVK